MINKGLFVESVEIFLVCVELALCCSLVVVQTNGVGHFIQSRASVLFQELNVVKSYELSMIPHLRASE